jgi:hypothetical protein
MSWIKEDSQASKIQQIKTTNWELDKKTIKIIWEYIKQLFMTKETAIKLFEEKRVRTVWDEDQEKW